MSVDNLAPNGARTSTGTETTQFICMEPEHQSECIWKLKPWQTRHENIIQLSDQHRVCGRPPRGAGHPHAQWRWTGTRVFIRIYVDTQTLKKNIQLCVCGWLGPHGAWTSTGTVRINSYAWDRDYHVNQSICGFSNLDVIYNEIYPRNNNHSWGYHFDEDLCNTDSQDLSHSSIRAYKHTT